MKLHGKNGQVHINGSQWLYATSWAVEVDRDFANVSVLGDAMRVWAGGLRGVEGSFDGLYDSAGANGPIQASFLDAVAVAIYAASGVLVASGDAWVTGKATGSVGDAVRVSGQFKGTGGWSVT